MSYFRPAELSDAAPVARLLRQSDRHELEAKHGQSLRETDTHNILLDCMRRSDECNTIILRDRPIGMFGIGRSSTGIGHPWLLGTDGLLDIRIRLLRQSLEWVDRQARLYPALLNFVDARNTASIAWLRFLGFTLTRRTPINGYDFWEFVRLGGFRWS